MGAWRRGRCAPLSGTPCRSSPRVPTCTRTARGSTTSRPCSISRSIRTKWMDVSPSTPKYPAKVGSPERKTGAAKAPKTPAAVARGPPVGSQRQQPLAAGDQTGDGEDDDQRCRELRGRVPVDARLRRDDHHRQPDRRHQRAGQVHTREPLHERPAADAQARARECGEQDPGDDSVTRAAVRSCVELGQGEPARRDVEPGSRCDKG